MRKYTMDRYQDEFELDVKDIEEGFQIVLCLPYPYYKSGKLRLSFTDAEVADDAPRTADGDLTIPGHNCRLGECSCSCQVADCAIHQGWQEVPYLCKLRVSAVEED